LACGDQRRLTGNGSALEVVFHDDALYKSTYFTGLSAVHSESRPKHRFLRIELYILRPPSNRAICLQCLELFSYKHQHMHV